MGDHLIGFAVIAGVILALIVLGVWLIDRVKKSPNRAAYAGMMLLFGSFLRVDPPWRPRSERIVKDAENDEAGAIPLPPDDSQSAPIPPPK